MRKSILKNKLIIFALITMGIFFVDMKGVEARKLNWDGVTVECIYNDGGLYESSYNDVTNQRVTNRYTYNLKGVNVEQTNTNSTFNYLNSPIIGASDGHYQCLPYVNVATNIEKNADGEKVPVVYAEFASEEHDNLSIANPNRGWISRLLGTNKIITLTEVQSYKLVSENYVLTSKSGNPNNVLSYKRQNSDTTQQVVSDPKTVSFLIYDNATLIQGPSKINYINVGKGISGIGYNSSTGGLVGTPTSSLNLTDPEPRAYVGNGSTVSYYFESPRYSINSNGDRYAFSGASETPEPFDNGDLCVKIMPNTAKIIAKVIGWCQLLVPALLIILVAIDLGKLMLSGNIDEELPKQKKRIVVRFIAAVFVFFLPFIIKLALTRVKVSGSSIDEINSIEYIDCIFEMVGIS